MFDPRVRKSRLSSISFRKRINILLSSIVGILAIGFALFPIPWVISAALDPVNALSTQSIIPQRVSLDNFKTLLDNPRHPYFLWMFNSLKVSGITSILTVLIAALGAYSFSRFRFSGRRSLLFTIMLVQIFPNILALVALYLIIVQIGRHIPSFGLNTHGGLILVYLGGAMGGNIWLTKGFFDSIPRELDDSALVDGATHWQVFRYIIFPLVRPVLTVIGILTFIGTYGDFLLARVLLNKTETYTLAVGLQKFIGGQYDSNWGPFAAGAVLGAIPIIVLFYLSQSLIVSGLTRGAVKG
jgi:arabinogalactan oligomer/maltooligosaccharide transport system permease protein